MKEEKEEGEEKRTLRESSQCHRTYDVMSTKSRTIKKISKRDVRESIPSIVHAIQIDWLIAIKKISSICQNDLKPFSPCILMKKNKTSMTSDYINITNYLSDLFPACCSFRSKWFITINNQYKVNLDERQKKGLTLTFHLSDLGKCSLVHIMRTIQGNECDLLLLFLRVGVSFSLFLWTKCRRNEKEKQYIMCSTSGSCSRADHLTPSMNSKARSILLGGRR